MAAAGSAGGGLGPAQEEAPACGVWPLLSLGVEVAVTCLARVLGCLAASASWVPWWQRWWGFLSIRWTLGSCGKRLRSFSFPFVPVAAWSPECVSGHPVVAESAAVVVSPLRRLCGRVGVPCDLAAVP